MLNRREFLKSMGIVGAGIAVAPKMAMGEVIKQPVLADLDTIKWTCSGGELKVSDIIVSDNEGPIWSTMVSVADSETFTVTWNADGVFKLE